MSVKVTTYEAFQTATPAFTNVFGPWTNAIDPALPQGSGFLSSSRSDCDGGCLVFQLWPLQNTASVWSVTYSANISVDLKKYGNTNTLDFTWTYWPVYAASNTQNSTTFPIHTQVNEIGFDDGMFGVPIDFFSWKRIWPGNLISHSGTTSVNRGSDSTGYISIIISYSTVPDGSGTMQHFTKGLSFKITTPAQSVAPAASPSGGATPSSVLGSGVSGSSSGVANSGVASSVVASSGILPLPTLSDVLSSGSSSGSSPNPLSSSSPSPAASQSAKMSTGEIGGIVVGSVALLALLVIAFVLYRRRKDMNRLPSWEESAAMPIAYPHEKHERPRSTVEYANSEPTEEAYSIPIVPVSHSPSGNPTPPAVGSHYSATNDTPATTANHAHPPIYDNAPVDASYDYVQPAFPALARWANANRALISRDLEARLEAAGYLPTDDPNNLSEEEWITEHNVTKLEVMRIRALYQADRQRLDNTVNPSG